MFYEPPVVIFRAQTVVEQPEVLRQHASVVSGPSGDEVPLPYYGVAYEVHSYAGAYFFVVPLRSEDEEQFPQDAPA